MSGSAAVVPETVVMPWESTSPHMQCILVTDLAVLVRLDSTPCCISTCSDCGEMSCSMPHRLAACSHVVMLSCGMTRLSSSCGTARAGLPWLDLRHGVHGMASRAPWAVVGGPVIRCLHSCASAEGWREGWRDVHGPMPCRSAPSGAQRSSGCRRRSSSCTSSSSTCWISTRCRWRSSRAATTILRRLWPWWTPTMETPGRRSPAYRWRRSRTRRPSTLSRSLARSDRRGRRRPWCCAAVRQAPAAALAPRRPRRRRAARPGLRRSTRLCTLERLCRHEPWCVQGMDMGVLHTRVAWRRCAGWPVRLARMDLAAAACAPASRTGDGIVHCGEMSSYRVQLACGEFFR